ncbi:22555_t:CDS:2, partial [Cetraspora pellucida]
RKFVDVKLSDNRRQNYSSFIKTGKSNNSYVKNKENLIILVVGSGGRVHAIAWKLSQSTKVEHIFVVPVGIHCFGPSPKAVIMKGSKPFSKNFMKKHNIPTADYEAKDFLKLVTYNVVIKASGLARDKGVLIHTSKQEALDALKIIMVDKVFGSAGNEVVIEEFLEGQGSNVLTFSNGYTLVSLPLAKDHKRMFDGDQ